MLKTSSTTKPSNNLLLSIDITEANEIGVNSGGNCEDETVGKSPSKNSNKATNYLISDARLAFI